MDLFKFKKTAAPTPTTVVAASFPRRKISYQPSHIGGNLVTIGSQHVSIGSGTSFGSNQQMALERFAPKAAKSFLSLTVATFMSKGDSAGFCSSTMAEASLDMLFLMSTIVLAQPNPQMRVHIGMWNNMAVKDYDDPGANGLKGAGFMVLPDSPNVKLVVADGVGSQVIDSKIPFKDDLILQIGVNPANLYPQFFINGTKFDVKGNNVPSGGQPLGVIATLVNTTDVNQPYYYIGTTILESD